MYQYSYISPPRRVRPSEVSTPTFFIGSEAGAVVPSYARPRSPFTGYASDLVVFRVPPGVNALTVVSIAQKPM